MRAPPAVLLVRRRAGQHRRYLRPSAHLPGRAGLPARDRTREEGARRQGDGAWAPWRREHAGDTRKVSYGGQQRTELRAVEVDVVVAVLAVADANVVAPVSAHPGRAILQSALHQPEDHSAGTI